MQVLSTNEKKESFLSYRLLIVDDNAPLRAILCQQLAFEGFRDVIEVGVLSNLPNMIRNKDPDLILLNIQMPDGNSVDICRRLRSSGFSKPIVMLTNKGNDDGIALGLEAGANDYIIKPLRIAELITRLLTQLRHLHTSDDMQFEIGNLRFASANKILSEIGSDRMQLLTEKESMILEFLYQAFPGDVSKAQILSEVWGFQNAISTHTLETHIYRLRQKISRLTDKQLVLTTEKGYRLAV